MTKHLRLLSTLLFIGSISFAQNPCEKILQDGLYGYTKMTNTNSFSQDFRTYLLSEAFKSDLKNGKWGSSISVPIKGVPVSLDANADNRAISEFRQKIIQETSLKINESNYNLIVSSIPNVNLAAEFTNCLEKTQIFGFKIIATYGDDYANFQINYNPEISTLPMPKVIFFNIENGTDIKNALQKDQRISNYNSVTCKRNPDKDVILTLQTNMGVAVYKIPAESSISTNRELPIGTIICSYLNFEQFNAASKNNEKSLDGIWMPGRSKWAPCDGRPVPLSIFQKLTAQNNVPDLRGMFLRGLNIFDPYQPVDQRPIDERDPEDRIVGNYQPDALKRHNHLLTSSTNVLVFSDYGHLKGGDGGAFMNATNNSLKGGGNLLKTDNDGGAEETRPKNVSIYYYIKIN